MDSRAIKIKEQGPPSVMNLEQETIGSPGEGEVLVRQSAIGINFMDVYQRSGLYPLDLQNSRHPEYSLLYILCLPSDSS